MVDNDTFRSIALSFANTEEHPHFHRKAFRIKSKTIFATLDEAAQTANLKLTEVDQSVFCEVDKEIIYPVPNAWGKQGWTTVDLKKISKKLLTEALKIAYETASIKKKK